MIRKTSYYVVEAKCGHVGRKNGIFIFLVAESKTEETRITRQIPRVKHNHIDGYYMRKQITEWEYIFIKE